MNNDVAEVNGSAPPQCYQALSSTRKSLGTRLHKKEPGYEATLHFAVTILFVTRYVDHPLSPALPAINTVINLLPYTEREGC